MRRLRARKKVDITSNEAEESKTNCATASHANSSESESDACSEEEWDVECIVAERTTKRKGREFLVKWMGYDDKDNSWEPEAHVSTDAIEAFQQKKIECH